MSFAPYVTASGIAAAASAQSEGLRLDITHALIGSEAYAPAVDADGRATQTALRQQRQRVPAYRVAALRPDVYEVHALFDGEGVVDVREIGFQLSDGTLAMVWSEPGAYVARKTAGTAYHLILQIDLGAFPRDSVTFQEAPPDAGRFTTPDLRQLVALQIQTIDKFVRLRPRIDQVAGSADSAASAGALAALAARVEAAEALLSATDARAQAAEAELATTRLAHVPPGAVQAYGGQVAPAGWLLCDGRDYLRADHAPLFGAIGTAFGAPDGSRFAVPDLRGVFVRGLDGGRGIDAGRLMGSEQLDALQAHRHDLVGDRGTPFYTINDENDLPPEAGATRAQGPTEENDAQYYRYTGQVIEARTATETRPRNVALNYIIKT
jgi:microcystin-dependent protein